MSIFGRKVNRSGTSKELMDRRYRSENDLNDLALRLDRDANSMDPYEYEDSKYSLKEALKDVNNPERLKGAIGYVEDTEEQMVDLDDEGVQSTFGFTRLQRKHLLSNLRMAVTYLGYKSYRM